jgi:hypothetical protein
MDVVFWMLGEDYIVIKPYDSPDWPLNSVDEYSRVGGQWFIKIEETMPILHLRGCKECSAKSIARPVSGF